MYKRCNFKRLIWPYRITKEKKKEKENPKVKEKWCMLRKSLIEIIILKDSKS